MREKRSGLRAATVIGFLCVVAALTPARAAQKTLLVGIDSIPLGEGTELQLSFDGSVPTIESFVLTGSHQIVLDLNQTASALSSTQIERVTRAAQARGVNRIEVVNGTDRSRLIVTLSQPLIHSVTTSKESLNLTLQPALTPIDEPQDLPLDNLVQSIEFERGSRGEALIVIAFAEDFAALGAVARLDR